jgi:hypothetical protein
MAGPAMLRIAYDTALVPAGGAQAGLHPHHTFRRPLLIYRATCAALSLPLQPLAAALVQMANGRGAPPLFDFADPFDTSKMRV